MIEAGGPKYERSRFYEYMGQKSTTRVRMCIFSRGLSRHYSVTTRLFSKMKLELNSNPDVPTGTSFADR